MEQFNGLDSGTEAISTRFPFPLARGECEEPSV